MDSGVEDESLRAGARGGHLVTLFEAAGLHEIEDTALSVSVEHPTFDDWWLPAAPFVISAQAWVARGRR